MSPLFFHGPGDRLDAHETDPNAHDIAELAEAVADAEALLASIAPPDIIIPPAAMFGPSAAPEAWFAANRALISRFTVPVTTTVRYVNFKIGFQAGDIEVGIIRLSGANHLSYERVVTSGVISCPASGNIHLDLGATSLTAGDYGVWFYATSTSMTVSNKLDGQNIIAAARVSGDGGAGAALAASGTISWSGRYMPGITVEGDF